MTKERIEAIECEDKTGEKTGYTKYVIGDRVIAIVPEQDSLYEPLVGKTREEAIKYVKGHQRDFEKASTLIRIGLLDFLHGDTMRPIKVEQHKTNVYDFEIRVGLGMPGSMAISVTTEELKEIVKQAEQVLASYRGNAQ